MNRFSLIGALALSLIVITAPELSAQVVAQRVALPSSGMPLDLAHMVAPSDAPIRIVISGTLSSSLDGSEIDAMGRTIGDRRIEAEGPFVRLPNGTRLVEEDPEIHRYTFELPPEASLPVALHLAPLAARHLVTLTELERSCTGALEVELIGSRPASEISDQADVGPKESLSAASTWLSAAAASSGGVLILLVGFVVRSRRKLSLEQALLKRCEAANQAVMREVRALGPAFDYVATASARLLESAHQMKSHLNETRRALARIEGLNAQGAQAKRIDLLEQESSSIERLQAITERLEETAADLAARQAGQSRVRDLDHVVEALDQELSTAVEATREARL